MRELFNTIGDIRRRARAIKIMKYDIKERGLLEASVYVALGAPADFDFDAIETCLRNLSLNQVSSLYRMVDADRQAMLEDVLVPPDVAAMAHRSLRESSDPRISSIEGSIFAGMNRLLDQAEAGKVGTT
jgi:hypothetical protein